MLVKHNSNNCYSSKSGQDFQQMLIRPASIKMVERSVLMFLLQILTILSSSISSSFLLITPILQASFFWPIYVYCYNIGLVSKLRAVDSNYFYFYFYFIYYLFSFQSIFRTRVGVRMTRLHYYTTSHIVTSHKIYRRIQKVLEG